MPFLGLKPQLINRIENLDLLSLGNWCCWFCVLVHITLGESVVFADFGSVKLSV